jgi:nucleotide-binding universal stress UspA family protein
MYRKVIVGHDLHEGGDDALALGKLIADATGAKLVVAGVFPFGVLPRGFEASWREAEVAIAAEIDRKAKSVGAEPEAFPAPSPAHGLHGLAEEIGADLVVVGSSRHSFLGQVLAGNVGLGLLHGSPCAVAIAPRGYRDQAELTTITVGFDGSEESILALHDAVKLGRATAADLRIVAVAEPPPTVYGKGFGGRAGWEDLKSAIEEHLREQLDEALRAIPPGLGAEATLTSGDPAVTLADAGRIPGTLLFIGSRGYGPLRRVLLGSVSSKLVGAAPCPMIVRPRGVQPPAATT